MQEHALSQQEWQLLTIDPEKIDMYKEDFYFRESIFEAWKILHALEPLSRITLLLIRPDTIVARTAEKVIKLVQSFGFEIISCHCVELDRITARALWYFQWNILTLERTIIADALNSSAISVLVILKDVERAKSNLIGSMRLAKLKGPSLPASRAPTSIRSKIAARNTIFCALHSPDETVDFIRELGVLLPSESVKQVYQSIAYGTDTDIMSNVRRCIEISNASIEFNELNYTASSLRSTEWLRNQTFKGQDEKDRQALLFALQNGDVLSYEDVQTAMRLFSGFPSKIDLLYFLSERVQCFREGIAPRITSASWKRWASEPAAQTQNTQSN